MRENKEEAVVVQAKLPGWLFGGGILRRFYRNEGLDGFFKEQTDGKVFTISHLEKDFLKFRPSDIIAESWGLRPTCK